jgi:hypothetical protein
LVPTILIRQSATASCPTSLRSPPYHSPKPPYPRLSFHTFTRSTSIATDDLITSYLAILCNLVIDNCRDDETANIAAASWQTASARPSNTHIEIAVLLDFGMRKLHNIAVPTGICPGSPNRQTEASHHQKLAQHLIYRLLLFSCGTPCRWRKPRDASRST